MSWNPTSFLHCSPCTVHDKTLWCHFFVKPGLRLSIMTRHKQVVVDIQFRFLALFSFSFVPEHRWYFLQRFQRYTSKSTSRKIQGHSKGFLKQLTRSLSCYSSSHQLALGTWPRKKRVTFWVWGEQESRRAWRERPRLAKPGKR